MAFFGEAAQDRTGRGRVERGTPHLVGTGVVTGRVERDGLRQVVHPPRTVDHGKRLRPAREHLLPLHLGTDQSAHQLRPGVPRRVLLAGQLAADLDLLQRTGPVARQAQHFRQRPAVAHAGRLAAHVVLQSPQRFLQIMFGIELAQQQGAG